MDKIYISKLSDKDCKEDIISSKFNDNLLEVEFIYSSDFKYTKDLRDFIYVIWNVFWFSEKLTTRLILISDELNNNAIEYWNDKNWEIIMRIKLEKKDSHINFKMEVEDNWDWKSPKTALEMETMRAHKLKRWYLEHNSIRWRWLFLIIVQIADRLYFKDTKKWWLIVWIKLKIKNKKNKVEKSI